MILQNCFYCHDSLATNGLTCEFCLASLNSQLILKINHRSTHYQPLKIFSIFSYTAQIRQLILLAKIKKSFFANYLLMELSRPYLSHLIKAFDVVVPAASSLFSRLRGNTDLAYNFAVIASDYYKASLLRSPYKMGWALRKQSQCSPDQRTKKIKTANISSQCGRILLIDDVTTSGNTLIHLAEHFPNALEIVAITLASAC